MFARCSKSVRSNCRSSSSINPASTVPPVDTNALYWSNKLSPLLMSGRMVPQSSSLICCNALASLSIVTVEMNASWAWK